MHRTRRILALAALLALPVPAAGQSVVEIMWSDLKSAPGDLIYVWTAPARIDGDDVSPLLSFAAVTGVVALGDREIQALVRAGENNAPLAAVEPFRAEHDGLSRLGQNHWVLRGAAVGYVIGIASGQDAVREGALGCAVGNVSNALPRKAVYSLVSRSRPQAAPDDPYDIDVPGGDWDVHSFFGGHAANAFTCASFLAHRFDLGWGEPIVWALATGVSAARVVDEAHWTSDTVVGSVFGFVAGRMIARRQLERSARSEARDRRGESPETERDWRLADVSAVPFRTDSGIGVVLGAEVVF